ncbi:hypothetical protein [Kitasatospora xanthocidica]|uniref:hypothetical protein n=1 Tax=Kitasatospora xanthocidica TaxID=83382 RepID=UPI001E4A1393|nr:hypothetical protein [Kitasatospora xanthocidica]
MNVRQFVASSLSSMVGELPGMLVEALSALAAAGGAGIVQAAATDGWAAVREQAARLLGRGRAEDEQAVRERLDRTRETLEAAAPQERAAVAGRQEASWQTRLEDFLEGLAPAEQAQAAERLRTLVELATSPGDAAVGVRADNSGVTAGGDVSNRGGVIGRDFTGPVTVGGADRPTPPGTGPR